MEAPSNTVHIWQIVVDPIAAADPVYQGLLDDDQLARAGRFRFDHDRLAFIHTHGSVRCVLGKYLKMDPAKICFQYSDKGRPSLATHTGVPSLHFNLSHTKGLALLAIASATQVGVDVEMVRTIPERGDIANRHFSHDEQLLFKPGEDDEAFFGCWTRKEALLKTIGAGLTRPLHTFGIVPDQKQPNWYRVIGDFPEADRWCVHSFMIEPGFLGAVAFGNTRLKPIFLQSQSHVTKFSD